MGKITTFAIAMILAIYSAEARSLMFSRCELMKGIECKQGRPLLAYDGMKYCSACDLMKTACQEMKIIHIESFTANEDGCLSFDMKTNLNKDKKDKTVKSTQTTKSDNSDKDIGNNQSDRSDKVIP